MILIIILSLLFNPVDVHAADPISYDMEFEVHCADYVEGDDSCLFIIPSVSPEQVKDYVNSGNLSFNDIYCLVDTYEVFYLTLDVTPSVIYCGYGDWEQFFTDEYRIVSYNLKPNYDRFDDDPPVPSLPDNFWQIFIVCLLLVTNGLLIVSLTTRGKS